MRLFFVALLVCSLAMVQTTSAQQAQVVGGQTNVLLDTATLSSVGLDLSSVSSEVIAHYPYATLLTAGFAQALWHIARASSLPMLPSTVLTQSHLGKA